LHGEENVGKGTIYLYFKNKEELFAEIITLLIQEMRVLADCSINPDKNLQQNLHHALFNIIEFWRNHQLINKLLQEEREIGTKVVKEEMERMEGSITFYFKEKIAAAELHARRPLPRPRHRLDDVPPAARA
jgi:AcrR family transcriptional regulator